MPKDNAVEPDKTEDDIAQEKAGPAVAPDTKNSKMTPQQQKNIRKRSRPHRLIGTKIRVTSFSFNMLKGGRTP